MNELTASEEAMFVKLEAQLDTGASCAPVIKPVANRTGIRHQVRCPVRSQITNFYSGLPKQELRRMHALRSKGCMPT